MYTVGILDDVPCQFDTTISIQPFAPCTPADQPTITPTVTLCTDLGTTFIVFSGSSATLSVLSGNLNDATDWTWYEGSCGGTPIGTGSSITVSPLQARPIMLEAKVVVQF